LHIIAEHLGILGREIHWEVISVLLHSRAGAVIFPLPDLLGLGSEARMNIPGTMTGNWRWRLLDGQLTETIMRRMLLITRDARRNDADRP
jgi:4-alpha-glucanotransferase